MKRYIGLDPHIESCVFSVKNERGDVKREDRVDTNAATLRSYIRSIAGERHLAMEEGMLSEWLYELLEPLTERTVVIQPARKRGNKSDLLDARARAEELRTNAAVTTVFKPTRLRGLREAVRNYDDVIADQTRCKQRLTSLFMSRGLRPGREAYDTIGRREWLAQLPDKSARRAQCVGDQLDRIEDLVEDARDWLIEESRTVSEVALLSTIPGIGPIRAAQIISIVVTPHRFRTKRQFRRYAGLGIVTRSSSERKRSGSEWVVHKRHLTRGLDRRCNSQLKAVFKGAAVAVSRMKPDAPLRKKHDSFSRNFDHRTRVSRRPAESRQLRSPS